MKTEYGVNHPLAVRLWRKALFSEVLVETAAAKFLGKNANAMIHWQDDLSKTRADRIIVGLRMQLTGAGVQGDNTLEDNEEALATYNDTLVVDQLRHAVRSGGQMSEQRVPFSVREEAKGGLTDWWAARLDMSILNQLAGNVAQTDVRYTGMQAPIAPDAEHIIRKGGHADDVSITSGDTFTLDLIDKAKARARTLVPAIRPIRQGGKEMYVMFLHTDQITSLRTNTATGQWLDITKATYQGTGEDNPIARGSLGMYNGVWLHEAIRLPLGVSNAGVSVANTRRAVFAGAQAALFGTGRPEAGQPDKMNWVEELFDYENQLGVAAGMIFGVKAAVFNGKYFGSIVVSSYAASS